MVWLGVALCSLEQSVHHENNLGRHLLRIGIAIDVIVVHHSFPRTFIDAAPPGMYEMTNNARAINCTDAQIAVSIVDWMMAEA